MTVSNHRALVAEAIGTASLLTIVVGSGIMGERLSSGNIAIALLANSLATGFGLFVLISAFGPISGAHFNPIVSLVSFSNRTMNGGKCAAYIAVQVMASIVGVLLAHAMFGETIFQIGVHRRAGASQFLSETIATSGLIIAIRAIEARGVTTVAAAVSCYIAAAYWFTASTSFANPAVTIARSFTTTFAGISPRDVAAFVGAQLVGGALALLASRYLFEPNPKSL